MALDEPIRLLPRGLELGDALVRPVQLSTPWQTIIDAGGLDGADNSGNDITNPTTQITAATHRIIQIEGQATIGLIRMGYDDALDTITAALVVMGFGRFDDNDVWMPLISKSGSRLFTPTPAADDVTDGTLNYTVADWEDMAFDLAGCREVLFGVKTALAASVGDVALSLLQFKGI